MSADTNWYDHHHHNELEKLQIEAWLKLPSFFLQDGRILSPHYLEFLKKETKNFEKEMCGNWQHENDMPKMINVGIVGAGSGTGKQRFPKIPFPKLDYDFQIEDSRYNDELPKLEGIGKQIKALNEQIKLSEPIEPRTTEELIEWIKTVFAAPYPYQNPIPLRDFSHGIQVEDKGYLFANEFMDPYNYKERVEEIALKMPPFVKPKPKKKAKVSEFKKRINSFLRKK